MPGWSLTCAPTVRPSVCPSFQEYKTPTPSGGALRDNTKRTTKQFTINFGPQHHPAETAGIKSCCWFRNTPAARTREAGARGPRRDGAGPVVLRGQPQHGGLPDA